MNDWTNTGPLNTGISLTSLLLKVLRSLLDLGCLDLSSKAMYIKLKLEGFHQRLSSTGLRHITICNRGRKKNYISGVTWVTTQLRNTGCSTRIAGIIPCSFDILGGILYHASF